MPAVAEVLPESLLHSVVDVMVRLVEAAGAWVIVVGTAISTSLRQLGQRAAVAAIRTALNFFLAREIREEQRTVEESYHPSPALASRS